MTKEELREWFLIDNKSGYKSTRKWLSKHRPELFCAIEENSIDDNLDFKFKILLYLEDKRELDICVNENCNNKVKYLGSIKRGFSKHCSNYCSNVDPVNVKKRNIGLMSDEKKKEITLKSKQTKLERYGDENYNNREMYKKTNLNKCGVENLFQLEEVKEKIRKTNLKKYGVDHLAKDNEYQKNKGKTIKKHYDKKSRKIISNKLNINLENVQIYKDSVIVKNYCKKHKHFVIPMTNFKSRFKIKTNLCTKCYPISSVYSINEHELSNFIVEDLELNAEKIKIEQKEIDIYIKDLNFGIEYNGLYWHSSKYIEKDYHYNKTLISQIYGIELIHIFENEWKFKKDILKSFIKEKLNMSPITLLNRYEIKEIRDFNLVENFYYENTIRDYMVGDVNIGLYNKNILISIISLKDKKNKNFKICGFSNKINLNFSNSYDILLNHFIDTYKPKKIIILLNLRLDLKPPFKEFNFQKTKIFPPKLYFFSKKESILFESKNENTDHEIYDCGNIEYVLKLE